jgi:AraC family transcriptional regulator
MINKVTNNCGLILFHDITFNYFKGSVFNFSKPACFVYLLKLKNARMPSNDIYLMKTFPDFNVIGFNINEYNKKFKENNVIISATSRDVSYPEHWGCLSVKCAFRGNEYYQSGKRSYAVNETNYLVLNEGTAYSSYIFSEFPVQSFTINFSHDFEMQAINGLVQTPERMLENDHNPCGKIEFTEKLYKHDKLVSPFIFKLFSLSLQPHPEEILIKELYYRLVENLLLRQKEVHAEIQKIQASKLSTRIELYRRLHYAKDLIDSCYMTGITLDKIASIAHLNTAYFLRQFKNYFRVTPYQYMINRRLDEARKLLETSDISVTDVCFSVGYHDLTSFIKLFKKYFSLSPECYQKQFRNRPVYI